MRRDSIILGLVMLVVCAGVGYMVAVGRLFFETRDIMHEMAADVAVENSDVKVRILAKQFTWHFHYPGDDGVHGASSIEAIAEGNEIGLDMSDPAAADDFVTTILVLPCGTRVELTMSSADVIHSLGHLEGDFEQDAIPGINKRRMLETPQLARSGLLKCVQLCGEGHADHRAPYQFIGKMDYLKWSSEQSAVARKAKAVKVVAPNP